MTFDESARTIQALQFLIANEKIGWCWSLFRSHCSQDDIYVGNLWQAVNAGHQWIPFSASSVPDVLEKMVAYLEKKNDNN